MSSSILVCFMTYAVPRTWSALLEDRVAFQICAIALRSLLNSAGIIDHEAIVQGNSKVIIQASI